MSKYTEFEQEMLDRSRRIETRLTKLGIAQGVEMHGSKPVWSGNRVDIPSRNCSIGDIMQAIPPGQRHRQVPIYVGGDYIAELGVHA